MNECDIKHENIGRYMEKEAANLVNKYKLN